MIKAEKGNTSIVGPQNEIFLELATVMFAIRERIEDEKVEDLVHKAFIFSGYSLEKIKLAAAFVGIFNNMNPNEQGEDQ